MKGALLRFLDLSARQTYTRALRKRMYEVGYEPQYVTDVIRMWTVARQRGLRMIIHGRDDAERACDVANEVRGVYCKPFEK